MIKIGYHPPPPQKIKSIANTQILVKASLLLGTEKKRRLSFFSST